ncbi:MAG TPA: ATP phosphoribosyltransferase [Acidimicrobiia bacterium]|nr:ATP phosphoribosyltransferase [Acidimicrobiia bacterium]
MNQSESHPALRIALPKRGRIADQLGPLCKDAGYDWSDVDLGRALFARLSPNIEAMFVRADDVPTVVADGIVDLGITGTDLVEESNCEVDLITSLPLSQCRLVLAAPPEWKKQYKENPPKSIRVATSFPYLAKSWGEKMGIDVQIISLSGSVEIAPRLEIADAIVDLTQTGATLHSNGLEEIETLREVQACIVSSRGFGIEGDSLKSIEARTFCDALGAVLNARGKRYVMMNVPKNALDQVRELVPGLASPTVIDLYGNNEIVALHVVIEADQLNTIIPQLTAIGVHGILVSRIERLIP